MLLKWKDIVALWIVAKTDLRHLHNSGENRSRTQEQWAALSWILILRAHEIRGTSALHLPRDLNPQPLWLKDQFFSWFIAANIVQNCKMVTKHSTNFININFVYSHYSKGPITSRFTVTRKLNDKRCLVSISYSRPHQVPEHDLPRAQAL